jgi:hypothetical protein
MARHGAGGVHGGHFSLVCGAKEVALDRLLAGCEVKVERQWD